MDHNTALLVAGFNGVAYFVSSLIPIWNQYVTPASTGYAHFYGSDTFMSSARTM